MAKVSWNRNQWPMPRKYFIFASEMLLFCNPPSEYSYPDCFTSIFFFQKSAPEIQTRSLTSWIAQSSYSISSSQSKKTTFKLCSNDTILFTMWPSSTYFCLHTSTTLIRHCYTVENKTLVLNSWLIKLSKERSCHGS